MTKLVAQMEARRLREELGMPIKVIATELEVSPGSVHRWTADIELTEEQNERNLRLAGELRGETWRELNRRRRFGYQTEGRVRARQGDAFHIAGCMLYWAEGSKARNSMVFANSDLEMVRFFWAFLRRSFGIGPADVSVRLNVYTTNGLSLREIEDRWLEALRLPRSCLRKPMINHFPTSSSGQKANKLPYGVCTLRVKRSTRILQHIYGAIQEYAGFEEPRWLDGPSRSGKGAEQPRTGA